MLHSHEGLDRAGGVARGGLLAPLRFRDFRLLWSGACISLLGDGAFLVALAWQVYELSDAPTAMSLVGIAMTVPTIVFLLVGGVASDRLDRRRIMLAADVVRAVAVGAARRALAHGRARAVARRRARRVLRRPGRRSSRRRSTRSCRSSCRRTHLAQANALEQIVRPLALRLAGPALGGVAGRGVRRRAPRSRSTPPRSWSRPPRCWPCAAARRKPVPAGVSRARRPARGLALRAPPHVAVGDVRQRGGRLPVLHGARSRCCCRSSSSRSWAGARPTSASSSPPAGSAPSAARC